MLTLHFAPNSRASRTLWLLEELGLEYELNRMDFHPKDLKSDEHRACLLYTSPSPRDATLSRMPSSA